MQRRRTQRGASYLASHCLRRGEMYPRWTPSLAQTADDTLHAALPLLLPRRLSVARRTNQCGTACTMLWKGVNGAATLPLRNWSPLSSCCTAPSLTLSCCINESAMKRCSMPDRAVARSRASATAGREDVTDKLPASAGIDHAPLCAVLCSKRRAGDFLNLISSRCAVCSRAPFPSHCPSATLRLLSRRPLAPLLHPPYLPSSVLPSSLFPLQSVSIRRGDGSRRQITGSDLLARG